jgi:hypothetical protein
MPPRLTVERLQEQMEAARGAIAGDFLTPQGRLEVEIELYRKVLRAVDAGHGDPGTLASIALRVRPRNTKRDVVQ